MMNYINLISEYYLIICSLVFLLRIIFLNLNLGRDQEFKNYYTALCCLILIGLFNEFVIDIWNRLDYYNSYDLCKNSGDIYFKFILIILNIIFLIYSDFYVKKMKFNDFEYLILIFFIIISFSFFIIVIDVISFYLLLEIQSFGFYLLTALNKRNQYSIESGIKYFVLSSFSSIILLFGFSFIYGLTGTLNISEYNLFFLNIKLENDILIFYILNILLITSALFFKLYVAPFHIWVSDIYQGAPTMSTAFFATITALPIFYFWSKYYFNFFSIIEHYLYYFILAGAVLSMFVGAIGALYQKKIKRLIAFSGIGNIGYVLVGFLDENPLLFSNAFTYFFIYILSTMSLFVIFLNLYLKKTGFFLERFSMLSGFLLKNRLLTVFLVLFFFTAAGMPPFSLFFSKILLLTGLSYQVYSVLLFILVFTSILSSFYYLRIIKIMTFEVNKEFLYFPKISYSNGLIIGYLALINSLIIWQFESVTLITEGISLYFYI